MPRLTDRGVRTAGPGRHGDGDGLHLVVSESGRRKWVFRFQMQGVRRDMGMGSYPAVSLLDARMACAAARKLIAGGVDPLAARASAKKLNMSLPTFGDVAALVIAEAQAKSTNAKVRYQWARHLGPAYCGPLLGRTITDITTHDVVAVLRPVWRSKPEVARKLYPAIRRVFDYARVRLRDEYGVTMSENPARWDDLKALGFEAPRQLSRGHHPSLPYDRLPPFMLELRSRDTVAARALEFLILTNVRTDAVLKARWAEFDLANEVWTVPLINLKDRAHRKEPFRVPLAPRALEIALAMNAAQDDFVFPGQGQGKPLSNMALGAVIRRMNESPAPAWVDGIDGRPIVPHGFRATFRTWAEETAAFPRSVVEQAMGHQVGNKVERAYRRTDVLHKRRELMAQWALFCSGAKASH